MKAEIKQVSDLGCEKSVLSSIIYGHGDLNDVRELLSIDCFYHDKNKEVYKAIISVADSGEKIDLLSVAAELKKQNSTINAIELVEMGTSFTSFELLRDCKRLRELDMRRKLWLVGMELSSSCTTETNDVGEVMQATKDKLEAVFCNIDTGVSTLRDIIKKLFETMSQNANTNGCLTGTTTGFKAFDEKGGLQPGNLIIVAGETSQGKTSYALSVAYNAIQSGDKVAFYSMEMTNEELGARLLSINSGVSSSDILYNSRLGEEKLKNLDYSAGVLKYDNMYFDDRSTSNIETILVSIRSMKIKHNIKGAVVDYMQILNVNVKNTNKEQAMGDVARRLKNLAKELGIWIIALSQLNRNSDNPVPNLNRLRDSGQIAEAADVVVFVHRPEYYGKSFPEPYENVSTEGKAMIDIAKGRNIGTMRFICNFDKKITFFSDITEERDDVDFNGYAPF